MRTLKDGKSSQLSFGVSHTGWDGSDDGIHQLNSFPAGVPTSRFANHRSATSKRATPFAPSDRRSICEMPMVGGLFLSENEKMFWGSPADFRPKTYEDLKNFHVFNVLQTSVPSSETSEWG